jgi:hypothetical protein
MTSVVTAFRKQQKTWNKKFNTSLENDNATFKTLPSDQQTALRDNFRSIFDVVLLMLFFQHFINPVLKDLRETGKKP